MADRTARLRDLLKELQDISENLPDLSDDELTSVGCEIWDIHRESQVIADKCKDQIRRRVPTVPGKHLFKGADGTTCQVVVSEPQITMRPATGVVQLRALEEALGTTFHQLFRVQWKVSPCKDFKDAVARANPTDADIALRAVDTRTSMPRVSFSRE